MPQLPQFSSKAVLEEDTTFPQNSSFKNIDFSKRQDVLGKTIVRALKRYYLELFNKSNDFKSFG